MVSPGGAHSFLGWWQDRGRGEQLVLRDLQNGNSGCVQRKPREKPVSPSCGCSQKGMVSGFSC